MKISPGFKVQSLILATALIIALGNVTHAFAQERSFLVDLKANSESL